MGTNVSYNTKKLVENGYLEYERSRHDRRTIQVRLSDKGRELCQKLNQMHKRNIEFLNQAGISKSDLTGAVITLRRLERLWMQAADFASRQPRFTAA